MKKEQIKKLINLSIFPVLLMVLGLVLAFNPDSATALLTKVLAWILLLCGAVKVLEILVDRDFSDIGSWLWAAVFLGAGLFFLKNPLILAKSIGVVLGILLVVEGVDGLRTALRLKSAGFSYLTALILAIVTLGAGCVLVLVPLTVSRLVVSIGGVVLIVIGAVNLVSRIRDMRRLEEPEDSNIIDADE